MEHLWVVEWNGRDVPSAELSPDLEGADVVVADTHFAVIRGALAEIEALVRDFPYWGMAGHPADGRWVGAGGDEHYISGGREVDSLAELADDLGLDPANFGGTTWDEVDTDLLYPYIKTF